MRAKAVAALLAVAGCLTYATAQATNDPCANQKPGQPAQEHGCSNPQVDAKTRQLVSQVYSAVQNGMAAPATGDQSDAAAALSYNFHMSDCENRWVALSHKPGDSDYTYGFVYIDPEAGFTLQFGGKFTIDAAGNFHAAPDPLDSQKINLKIRLEEGNGVAALLPPRAITQLGLPEKPDWLKSYEDKSDPLIHKANWGSFYNGMGDSRRALEYLEPAYKEKPDNHKVVFELAYAYNALERPADAIQVAKGEWIKSPKDELLCREMAFAYLSLKSFKEATEQYPSCIALCDDSEAGRAEKSELEVNLGAAYQEMGDKQNHDEWLNKAKEWAPKGSAVYKHFHPGEE